MRSSHCAPRILAAAFLIAAIAPACGTTPSGGTPGGDAGLGDDGGATLDAGGGADADSAVPSGPLQITSLRTEYRVDPIGIDAVQPRLEWKLQSKIRAEKQTAYRVIVASTRALADAGTGDLWDTAKVVSDQSTQITYAGKALTSRQTAWWRVQVWDKDGVLSPWSDVASWELGLLAASDWSAQWITAPSPALDTTGLNWIWYPEGSAMVTPVGTRFFRRTFTVPAGAIKAATIAISADDAYDLYVNGIHASAGTTWQSVAAVNIAPLVKTGSNTIAVMATNTSEGASGLVAQVRIDTGSGSPLTLSSDTSWRSSSSAPPAGWQLPGYDDSAWTTAKVMAAYGSAPWGSPAPGVAGGGPARYLRRTFSVTGQVVRARLYATALGLYEASLNGDRIGSQHFAPGWTDYTRRAYVQTYDVTDKIKGGDNAIGLILSDGWYQGKVGYGGRDRYGVGPIRAFAQLEIDLSDGTRQVIVTNGDWASAGGPIAAADLLDGETYDARREMPGWDAPGFTADGWTPSMVVPGSGPLLVAQSDEGVQVETERAAESIKAITPGVYIYDLGQNMVGWTRLRVQGAAGAALTLRFAEVLNPDGTVYTTNMRGAAATDHYTLRGGGVETYEPRFTSHGFRYVELSGDVAQLTTKPDLSAITGIVAHAVTPPTGTLVTSDPVVNQLQSNIVWSQKDNFTDVPTDCPQRDERLGWMGDAQIFVRTSTLNMDVAAFFTKWMKDVDEAQDPNGAFGDVSPNPGHISGSGTPAWGDAGVIVPWTVYLAYGDTKILADHFDAMARWVDYISQANPSFLWETSRGSDFGDWLSINADTDKAVLATAFYAHSADILAKAAHVLGKSAEEAKYGALRASIVKAFDDKYVASDGHITSDTQTAYALALRFGLVDDTLRLKVAALLDADIAAHAGYLTTGFIGVGHLLPALSGAGMTDTAYKLLDNDGFPSWRYEINHGATTIWEHWDGIRTDGSFQDPGMNSFNHYSFGSVDEWMYGTIGGLELDESSPGWKAFRVRPTPGGGLTSAKATLDSPYGMIVSDWKIAGGTFSLSVTVPVNTTATVYLPYAGSVKVDGASPPASNADGGYPVASGTYVFTTAAP